MNWWVFLWVPLSSFAACALFGLVNSAIDHAARALRVQPAWIGIPFYVVVILGATIVLGLTV